MVSHTRNNHYIYISEDKNEKYKKNAQNKIKTKNFDTSQSKNKTHFVDKKNNNQTKNIFTKPSINEIQSYCRFRKNNIDAQVFFDFYESVGWHVGKSNMYDWRATIRVWEYRNKQKIKLYENKKREPVVKEMDYSDEALERFFGMPVEQHNALVMANTCKCTASI